MTMDTEPPAPPAPAGRRGRGYFLPGLIALAALLALGLFVGAGDLEHPAPHRLDGTAIASQIALAIQVEQNSAAAPRVSCPPDEPVRAGFQFDCSMAGSPSRTVRVTEVDDRGQVRWAFQP